MKLDILVFASHPDDAELCTGGTLAKHVSLGHKVGIVDFTRGELGTRGTPELRLQEAAKASEILGLSIRENMGFADGFFRNDEEHQRKLIAVIRKYQPEIVLANAVHDRHSDHGRAAELAYTSCFLSGLARIETSLDGAPQSPWRPKAVYHYIQSLFIEPDFIVDISDFWDIKVASYMAYKSQVFDPESKEPETFISKPQFLKLIESRAIEFGHAIGTQYGEGYTVRRYPGIHNLLDLI
jgi:N-acetylglucosamine malate deacetylase 1